MPPSPVPAPTPAELAARDRRDRIAERWLWLVERIYRQEFRGRGDHDDLCSEGQYALLMEAGTGRLDEGRRPGIYLSRAIRWAMKDEVRRAARRAARCPGLGDNEGAGSLPDPHGDRSSAGDMADRIRAEALLRKLGPLETRVVALTYGIDDGPPLTQAEVGRELGMSRSHVGDILRRALRSMGDAGEPAEVRKRLGVAS